MPNHYSLPLQSLFCSTVEEKRRFVTHRHSSKVTYPSLFKSMSLKNSESLRVDTVRPADLNAPWSSFLSNFPFPSLSIILNKTKSFASALPTKFRNSIAFDRVSPCL